MRDNGGEEEQEGILRERKGKEKSESDGVGGVFRRE